MAAVAQQGRSRSAVQDVAAELVPSTPDLGRGMADHISAAIPELDATGDPEFGAELLASTEANIGQVMRMLAHGASADDITIPHEALDFLRGNVRRGLPLAVVLRSYRIGHAWLWERWSQALQDRVVDSGELAAGQDESSAFMFAYVDKVSDALVEEFGTERERMLRSAEQLRADTVRAILEGEAVDVEAASRRLGYELRRHHVALRVSSGAHAVEGLERAVGEAAAAVCPGDPVVIPSGAARFDVWCGSFDPLMTDRLESYEPPRGVLVAFGKPSEGVAGFGASHIEAVQAARIHSLAPRAIPPVTSYARVELVSLLASDLPRARAFVAGHLGPLASSEVAAERLRETVLAFLVSGGSPTRVARDLYVHQNTVAYRVKQAEELLGHEVGQSPVELTCALTLAAALGAAVLADEDGEALPD
jgi:PucR C-terminal helix-turn-helix domain/GGDEF-like domain